MPNNTAEKRRAPADKDERQPQPSPAKPKQQWPNIDMEEYVENWLSTSFRSRRSSVKNKALEKALDNIPRKTAEVPRDMSNRTTSSRETERSAASIHDSCYR